jgi:hypothetical protein
VPALANSPSSSRIVNNYQGKTDKASGSSTIPNDWSLRSIACWPTWRRRSIHLLVSVRREDDGGPMVV